MQSIFLTGLSTIITTTSMRAFTMTCQEAKIACNPTCIGIQYINEINIEYVKPMTMNLIRHAAEHYTLA